MYVPELIPISASVMALSSSSGNADYARSAKRWAGVTDVMGKVTP